MAGTNHVVDVYLDGLSTSFLAVNPEDTVQWSCPSGPSNSVDVGFATGATITFTGSTPFASGAGSTIDITNNGTSAKYTISDEAKAATYSYQVAAKDEGQPAETFTGKIQVTDDMIVDMGDGNVMESPEPKLPVPSEKITGEPEG